MDTSLAEEVQQTMATLAPNRFFFMSPYRSFTTSGCFARFDEPAVNGDSPDSPFLNPGSRSPVRKNKLPHAVSPAASR